MRISDWSSDVCSSDLTVQVSFVSPPGAAVRIRRIYTLSRGSYAIAVHDAVLNDPGQPWQGYIYRQLARIPPDAKRGVTGMTNPESYIFAGATWFRAADGYVGRASDPFIADNSEARRAGKDGVSNVSLRGA